ncbi:centrosomal protein of 164 kDa [Scaptodrosophila lebanonensis]|uniref:Centrosomal protein of 164 kDa n=1 Tax=Drosophila lebanonensis TaxID=7225 RepID=A0A6J2TDD0_DROLE|nr:centrosomal protein of 164 kDa [Scaptodrosophila lebanonensis]
MNFSVDDPLADLLSDNSLDNDNFFDNTTGRKLSKQAAKSKGKLEDLFGIQEETEVDIQPPPKDKPIATSTPRIVKQKPSISQDDVGDDDDLGFDPKRPKSGVKKSLFVDLLSVGEAKKNVFDDILSGGDSAKRPATSAVSTVKPSMSRQSTDTTTDNSNVYTQARPKTATGRRSSAQSTNAFINTDPLGLFGRDKETSANASGMSTPVSKKRSNPADWLGLGVENATTVESGAVAEPERPATPRSPQHGKEALVVKNAINILRLAESDDTEIDIETPAQELPMKMPTVAADPTAQNILLLNSINLESNNTFTALQQQESQLIIASQMKAQESALLEMQRKQDILLQQQNQKFQTLIQQQLQRQQQMEDHIKMQQQRINTHIQLMMTQSAMVARGPIPPPMTGAATDTDAATAANIPITDKTTQAAGEPMPSADDQLLKLENDVKRNELEKLRLEELVANMKVNYEQEIQMIENSYKKQLQVLSEHMAAVEERLKAENTELKEFYVEKLQSLEQALQKLKNDYEGELSTLRQDHEDEVRKLRKSHEVDIDMVRQEHHRMLDTIRQSKMLEFATMQESGSYLETLQLASNNLVTLSDGLQGLRDDMSCKLETLNKERERKLNARERLLDDKERRLKIDEEAAEGEKRRLMELVGTLELQLGRLSKESAEENWQLRQRMCSLEAEKNAFEREKEFHREQLERDEKRVEELKTLQLAETERMKLDLQQERTRLVIERTQIEMERKLQSQGGLDKDRLEVEAQLKVAEDAIRQADEERQRCHKQQRDLEQRKRLLLNKENALNLKEDELAQASSAYRMATGRMQAAEHKARESEQFLEAKLQQLAKRTADLGEKEAQLSQERMLLAKDRIALHNMKQQIAQSKCSLCKMGANSAELALNTVYQTNGNTTRDPPALHQNSQENVTARIMTSNQLPAALIERNIVDRMLDENIEASYRRMYNVPTTTDMDYWTTAGLDDDSKKLAMGNNNL